MIAMGMGWDGMPGFHPSIKGKKKKKDREKENAHRVSCSTRGARCVPEGGGEVREA